MDQPTDRDLARSLREQYGRPHAVLRHETGESRKYHDWTKHPLVGAAVHRLDALAVSNAVEAGGCAPPIGAPSGTLYLDLDGVFADFGGQFERLFGVKHTAVPREDKERMFIEHPTFFQDMPVIPGSQDFFARVAHLNPIILTACPRTGYARVAKHKAAWVREYLSTRVMVLPVPGRHTKPLFMHARGDVLVDDYWRNVAAWSEAGGVGVLHQGDFDATARDLGEALQVPLA